MINENSENHCFATDVLKRDVIACKIYYTEMTNVYPYRKVLLLQTITQSIRDKSTIIHKIVTLINL